MVSVRMPDSLFKKLKEISEKDHYMDISEEIRSIVRKNWMKSMHPELLEIKELKKSIMQEISKKSKNEIAKQIIKELNYIKKKIVKGENDE